MTKHEQLALALQSAGACEPSSEEYSLSLIVEEDNDLLIKEYREGDIKQQVFVAEQVRTGTDAPLINLEDQVHYPPFKSQPTPLLTRSRD
jgi:hypothetical protein